MYLLNGALAEEADYFFIKFEGKYEKIRADEILYIRSQQNHVIIYAKIGKYITLMSLKTLVRKPKIRTIYEGVQIVHYSHLYSTTLRKIRTVDWPRSDSHISRANKDFVIERLLGERFLGRG